MAVLGGEGCGARGERRGGYICARAHGMVIAASRAMETVRARVEYACVMKAQGGAGCSRLGFISRSELTVQCAWCPAALLQDAGCRPRRSHGASGISH